MAVTGDVLRGDLQTSSSQSHCPAAALVWGLLPQHKGKQFQALSETLGKSWVHEGCALGKCPMAPLTGGPFLHLLHLLWTLASILKGKTMTSIFIFSNFWQVVKDPGCSWKIPEPLRAGMWRRSPFPRGSSRIKPASEWQIPMAGTGALSSPCSHFPLTCATPVFSGMRWPQSGHPFFSYPPCSRA